MSSLKNVSVFDECFIFIERFNEAFLSIVKAINIVKGEKKVEAEVTKKKQEKLLKSKHIRLEEKNHEDITKEYIADMRQELNDLGTDLKEEETPATK